MHALEPAFAVSFCTKARAYRMAPAASARPAPKRPPPRPRPRPRGKRGGGSGGSGDVRAYSLSETVRDSPLLNSTLMNAMRDYFGDDGREVQDYMKRPLNARGEPTFRCVIVGSGARERRLARVLADSALMRGLYYCPDHAGACDMEMNRVAQSATVSAQTRAEDVLRFARWCLADAVFIGPDRQHCVPKQVEAQLAHAGITVFPHDVSAAIADGSMDVKECLLPLAQSESDGDRDDVLVEDEVAE